MSKNKILNKNDCIQIITVQSSSTTEPTINVHPLLSVITQEYNIKKDLCLVIPQVRNNTIAYMKSIDLINKETDEDNIADLNINIPELSSPNIHIKQEKKQHIIEEVDRIMCFTLPINSNNFLEIIFNISNLNQLNEWLNTIDQSEIKAINIVLDLYWKNYYNSIDNDLDSFIKINHSIIHKILNNNVSFEITTKIVNKLIRKNYGKKIKYLSKIKKYLTKYI